MFEIHLVADTSRGPILPEHFIHIHPRIQGPVRVGPIDVHNSPNVIDQRDVHIETAGNEPTGLEEVVVILHPRGLGSFSRKIRAWWGEPAHLIDGCQLFDDVVVKAIEHDEEHTATYHVSADGCSREASNDVLRNSNLVGIPAFAAQRNNQASAFHL